MKHSTASETDPRAEHLFTTGLKAEKSGLSEQAADAYEQALGIDPDHDGALFRLALLCDRHGDDARAIELYERLCAAQPVHVNALMNLAVLYEDHAHYEEALACLNGVLASHPNHARALLFHRDVMSAYGPGSGLGMDGARLSPLDAPITDFELSVRSRNCLKKMGLHTLGDLLKTTEQELLSYKNFGDTSLAEIKALLASKGYRLGQAAEILSLPGGDAPDGEAVDGAPVAEATEPDALDRSVNDLELSIRSRKALQKLDINVLRDLVQRTEQELMACKNFGQTSLTEIKHQLAQFGLALRTSE